MSICCLGPRQDQARLVLYCDSPRLEEEVSVIDGVDTRENSATNFECMKAPTNDAYSPTSFTPIYLYANSQSLSRDACRQVDIHRHSTCTDMNVVNPFASTSRSPLTFKNMELWCELFVFNDNTVLSLVTAKSHHTSTNEQVASNMLRVTRVHEQTKRRRLVWPDKVAVGSWIDAKAVNASFHQFIVKHPPTDCTSKMGATQSDRRVHDDTSSMRIVFNTCTCRRPDGE